MFPPQRHTLLAVALFAFVAGASGCRSTQPARTQLSDSAITTKVVTKFSADPEINPFNISVETSEGVVYLMGRVAEEEDKREAEQLAQDTAGVTQVVNHLKVGTYEKPATNSGASK